MKMAAKQWVRICLWLIVGAVLIVAGFFYFQYQRNYPSTDDAYLQANVVNVAAQVSGLVSAIYVKDNDIVKQGQLLFTIDPTPFQLAFNKAQANLDNANQQVIVAQQSLQVAQAEVAQRQARFVYADKEAQRISALVKKDLLSKEAGDQVTSRYKVAQAALQAANSQLQQAQEQLTAAKAQVRAAQALLAKTQFDLANTQITAPVSGKIVDFSLRVGDAVTPLQQLFALIDTSEWWIQANFKETDLARIRPGQNAKVKLDMYPGQLFYGRVQSISSGSGAAFSLLPPENATGNWVKVTQRFPVRIELSKADSQYPFRVGASAVVTIDTLAPKK